jgi:hypothetical protein
MLVANPILSLFDHEKESNNIPLLRLVPSGKKWNGNEDHNGLATVTNLNL